MSNGWVDDGELEKDLRSYVGRNLKRTEILDYMRRDYNNYHWSLRTLARRLQYLNISYIDYETPVDRVREIVEEEVSGPGGRLGYRALNLKLRTNHDIKVPRNVVYNVLCEVDPEGLEERRIVKKEKKEKRPFTSKGPLWLISLDGHDKLCGYQNFTFPLGVYGCLDTFSRKVLFLFVCFSNSDPNVIGKRYLKYLNDTRTFPRFLRIDRGTETGKMCTIHAYISDRLGLFDDPLDSIMYGPSTTNKIERFWRDLHHRMETFFKDQLRQLLDERSYDPHDLQQRKILAYVYIPIIQRECDDFAKNWNSHRIRKQKDLILPTGNPDHMFSFPESYGGTQEGTPLPNDLLDEVSRQSGISKEIDEREQTNFMERRLLEQCEYFLPDPVELSAESARNAYLFLKQKLGF